MMKAVMLDTGPLGRITHPRRNPDIVLWLDSLLSSNIPVILPEIADYELRRNLLLENLTSSLNRLDRLKEILIYIPITTETMLTAAKLWAEARKHGFPSSDVHALDGDVILAAQAIQVSALIATENVKHLNRLTNAKHWKEINEYE